MKIYHNPKCSKSREALALLRQHGVEPEVVEYLKEPLTKTELKKLVALLGVRPIDIVRTKEAIWKEQYAGMSESDVFDALVEHPVLLERPIVVEGGRAAIGRPPENVLSLLDK